MFLSYRYRLLPTKRQHRALEAILESQRQLYNAALQERIAAYEKAGVSKSYSDQTRSLTEWRQSDPDGRVLPVSLQRGTLKKLDEAFMGFYRRLRNGLRPGFPRYRGKGRFRSFGFREFEGITLKGCRIRFRGCPASIRVHMHRPLPQEGVIRSCEICSSDRGWTLCLAVQLPMPPVRAGKCSVGVDLGLTTFATLSDGSAIPSLRAARRAERRLRLAQRALARKRRGSVGRRKARAVVNRVHRHVRNRRRNHLHQASARLVRDYDVIAVERLRFAALARSKLAKAVKDASWAEFVCMLRYKAECAGARLVEVDPNDTSQDCSRCGARAAKRLSDRVHECAVCGLSLDRDLNAAINILRRAGVGPGLPNVAGMASVQAETSD